MNQPDADTSSAQPAESLLLVAALGLLSVTGAAVSAYLAWTTLTAGEIAGCSGGTLIDCDHVLKSHWSRVAGIPVSIPAVLVYTVLLSTLPFCRSPVPRLRQLCWTWITVCGLSAGMAALWFIGLQVFALKHLCPWCLATHTCSLLISGLLLWKQPATLIQKPRIGMVAAAAVVAVIGVQLATPEEERFRIEHHDMVDSESSSDSPQLAGTNISPEDSDTDIFAAPGDVFLSPDEDIFAPPPAASAPLSEVDLTTDEDQSGGTATTSTLLLLLPPRLWFMPTGQLLSAPESQTKTKSVPQQERRLISVQGNRFRLDARQWPLLGPPDAKYIFVEMFDYTCPHCRNTHRAIQGAFKKYGNDLAIISLPVPLDRRCNSSARSSGGIHRDSCEISRIAVAVWRIDPQKFHQLHDWIFQGTRSAAATRRQAEQLVGQDALAKELKHPTAGQYIQRHVELYKRVGAGTVPKLMFPRSTMVGEVSSTSTLCSTIERELGK